jgi:hypothetical protein
VSCPSCGKDLPEAEPRCPGCGKVLGSVDGPPGVILHYTGSRYAIGQGQDHYGIWDLIARGGSVERFAMSAKGWSAAWAAYTSLEKGYRLTSMSLDHRADAAARLQPRRTGRIVVVLGGLAVGVSVMLPWAHGGPGGHETLLGIHGAFDRSIEVAWALPILGSLAALVALRLPRLLQALGTALGVLSVALAASLFFGPLHGLTALPGIGAGPYTAVGGGVLMVIGGALSR